VASRATTAGRGCRQGRGAWEATEQQNTKQQNINETKEYHRHTSKQDIRISVRLYRSHKYHARAHRQGERQQLDPLSGGGPSCRW